MKAKPYTLFLHPAFLISLVLLLLNDFYLKYAWHNALTGKLSDFAGLFVFAIFLFVVFPSYKKNIIIFCVLIFCWWKSPLSSSFIQLANENLSLPIYRTIDYTDLFALLILPFTLFIRPREHHPTFIRSAAICAISIVSFFSFCATSMMPRHLVYYPYRMNEVSFVEYFNSSLTEEEVLAKLDPEKLGYKIDSIRFYKVQEPGTFYQRVNSTPDTIYPSIYVANNKDTSLFIRKKEDKFYTVPRYILNGDTLLNLEFRVFHTGKKKRPTRIITQSFQTTKSYPFTAYNSGNLMKSYKKHFSRLFHK